MNRARYNGIVYLLTEPDILFPGIVYDDPEYVYCLLSVRSFERGSYLGMDSRERALDEATTVANTVGAFGWHPDEAAILAHLIWGGVRGIEGVWLFIDDALEEPLRAVCEKLELKWRHIDYVSFERLPRRGTYVVSFQSRRQIEQFLVQHRNVTLSATWISLAGVKEQCLDYFTLLDGADYYLFERMARGQIINQILLGLSGGEWRLSAKHDTWHLDTGDPIFAIQKEEYVYFRSILTRICDDYGYKIVESKMEKRILENWIRQSVIEPIG